MISSQSCGFVHAKSRTRIGCWKVRSVVFLSDQSDKLRSVIDTMKLKKIDLLALSESHWRSNGVAFVCGTTILYLYPFTRAQLQTGPSRAEPVRASKASQLLFTRRVEKSEPAEIVGVFLAVHTSYVVCRDAAHPFVSIPLPSFVPLI